MTKGMQKIVFVVGPTAVGKSEVAACLARKIRGEIISCDSMQVYKGMEIISSQPPKPITKKIPHHLINFISPSKDYNVSTYRKAALKKISEIIKKNKTPILVGGTGFYMSILLDGIFEVKAEDKILRQKLYKKAEKYGSAALHNELIKFDPQAAEKIHPNDLKRIIRAIEVYKVTGKRISDLQKERVGLKDKYDVNIFCLTMPREKLYAKIQERTKKMFKAGLLKEVKNLLKKKLSRTAGFAIGINEIKGYLDREYDLEEARKKMARNTCLYSKRQLTWFRKAPKINWIEVKDNDSCLKIAGKIWKKLF